MVCLVLLVLLVCLVRLVRLMLRMLLMLMLRVLGLLGSLLRLGASRAKRRSIGLQSRRDGRVVGTLTAVGRRGIRRELAVVATWHSASGNAADASVVVVEMLLSVVVCVAATQTGAIGFDSGHVVGRVRLVQLWRRSHGVSCRGRGNRSSRGIRRGLGEELHAVNRVTDISRTGVAGSVAVLSRRADGAGAVDRGGTHGRHSLCVATR